MAKFHVGKVASHKSIEDRTRKITYSEDSILALRQGGLANAIKGSRGQAFLREMLEALDALPERRLINGDLICADDVCAIGSVMQRRGINVEALPLYPNVQTMAQLLKVAQILIEEILSINENDVSGTDTPERRFERVRAWIVQQLGGVAPSTTPTPF